MSYTITINAEQDDIPVRGNAMASGDDAEDKAAEDEIIRRLDNGDIWAWAVVTVKATCEECEAEGCAYLGACSYADEKDFIDSRFTITAPDGVVTHRGYYDDMLDEAKEECRKGCTCRKPEGLTDGARVSPAVRKAGGS